MGRERRYKKKCTTQHADDAQVCRLRRRAGVASLPKRCCGVLNEMWRARLCRTGGGPKAGVCAVSARASAEPAGKLGGATQVCRPFRVKTMVAVVGSCRIGSAFCVEFAIYID